MHQLNRVLAGSLMLLALISVQAQAPWPASSAASVPKVMAPLAPPVSAPSAGASPHGRYGVRFTPGWADMTSQERDTYRTRMLNARTVGKCRKIQTEHNKQLAGRGYKPLTQPGRDPCDGLPGRLGLP